MSRGPKNQVSEGVEGGVRVMQELTGVPPKENTDDDAEHPSQKQSKP